MAKSLLEECELQTVTPILVDEDINTFYDYEIDDWSCEQGFDFFRFSEGFHPDEIVDETDYDRDCLSKIWGEKTKVKEIKAVGEVICEVNAMSGIGGEIFEEEQRGWAHMGSSIIAGKYILMK